MRTRPALYLTLSTGLLALAPSAHAQQRANFGQQVGQQLLNNMGNRALGQPTNAYPNQGYGSYPNQGYGSYPNQGYGSYPNQAYNPYTGATTRPYQVQRPAYGPNGYQSMLRPGQGQPGYLGQPAAQHGHRVGADVAGRVPGAQAGDERPDVVQAEPGREQRPDLLDDPQLGLVVPAVAVRVPPRPNQTVLLVIPQRPGTSPGLGGQLPDQHALDARP